MPPLQTRRLGKSEINATVLGLGGGHLAGNEQTEQESIALIRGAIERGINFVDTSPNYGLSEERYGRALADGWRDKVYLQTKVGSHPRFMRNWSRNATIWSLENSFTLLQTEYVDSVLIHGPRHDIEEPLGHCLDVMLEWKEKGRIGAVGVGRQGRRYHPLVP
jgi:aryl-alcohol dehydrogenase-like predicted oxidoreductase